MCRYHNFIKTCRAAADDAWRTAVIANTISGIAGNQCWMRISLNILLQKKQNDNKLSALVDIYA